MSSFDQKAHTWDQNSRRNETANKVAQGIKDCIKASDLEILDFGCGTGLISFNLADIATSIQGIDTSEKMVEVFNQKSCDSNIFASCQDLDSLEKKFDLIVSSMTFHHIKDIESLITKLSDKLKPNGKICVADLVKEDGSFHSDNKSVEHFGFEIKELIRTFEKSGLKKECQKIVHTIQKAKEYPVFLLCFKKV